MEPAVWRHSPHGFTFILVDGLGRLQEVLSGLNAAPYHRVRDELTLEVAPDGAGASSEAEMKVRKDWAAVH